SGQVTFEVAPDPRNPTLVARWAEVPQAVRDVISHNTAWQVAQQAMEGGGVALWGRRGAKQLPVGLKAELHRNNGHWGSDANPSLSLIFTPGIRAPQASAITRLMGYALRQE